MLWQPLQAMPRQDHVPHLPRVSKRLAMDVTKTHVLHAASHGVEAGSKEQSRRVRAVYRLR